MSVRIGVGLAELPVTSARELFAWVDRCEDSPIDSLWQTDRLVSSTPMLETMSAMASFAGRTQRIKFGMNAVVLPFRDPLLLAKQCASIDFLSGGRLLPVFGVGGDRAPEWRASGRGNPRGRGSRANEALQVIQRLLSESSVSFEGRHFRYADISIQPAPVQSPLPCWIGGSSPAALRRTAQLGSGWLGGAEGPEAVRRAIAGIRHELQHTGRTIAQDHYGATLAYHIGPLSERVTDQIDRRLAMRVGRTEDMRSHELVTLRERAFALGSSGDLIERIRALYHAGASKFVLIPLATNPSELLEQTEMVIHDVIPEVHAWSDPPLPQPAPPSSL